MSTKKIRVLTKETKKERKRQAIEDEKEENGQQERKADWQYSTKTRRGRKKMKAKGGTRFRRTSAAVAPKTTTDRKGEK